MAFSPLRSSGIDFESCIFFPGHGKPKGILCHTKLRPNSGPGLPKKDGPSNFWRPIFPLKNMLLSFLASVPRQSRSRSGHRGRVGSAALRLPREPRLAHGHFGAAGGLGSGHLRHQRRLAPGAGREGRETMRCMRCMRCSVREVPISIAIGLSHPAQSELSPLHVLVILWFISSHLER